MKGCVCNCVPFPDDSGKREGERIRAAIEFFNSRFPCVVR